jgi:serine/threonine protein kinase/tetratricopeptide (TPR) repeat protein
LLLEQTSAREAAELREHLVECASCRAVAAGIEIKETTQKTVADESLKPARKTLRQPAARDDRTLNAEPVTPPADLTVRMSIGEMDSDRTVAISDSGSFNESHLSSPGDPSETCYFPSEDSSNQFGKSVLADSAYDRDSTDGYFSLGGLPRDVADTLAGLPEGVSVPGYDILEELGRGGMGVVYKARHRRLQRLVALKMVLAGAHAGAVGLARFRAEAEAVAKLQHANIVQIYETGEHEGRPFFSLEFVDGGSLDQRIGSAPTNPRAAAHLMETLARTMDVAHQRGIVHRDLKPANILLAKIGSESSMVRHRETDASSLPAEHWVRNTVPKIADFGLAKNVEGDSGQTGSGTILGTPSYMAPEQAGGKNREVGPAADVYSLGAILYELLVGRPPFKAGNPIDTIRMVLEQEPVPPRQLEPRVPHDLETICLKCLEKDPARRFARAADLADDLHRFLVGDPVLARPTPAWERAWKWGKRRPLAVMVIGLSVALVLGAVSFIAWHNVSLRSRLDKALADERQARKREQDALEEHRLTLVRQEAQKLFDSARVAAVDHDWTNTKLNLVKALTTIGGEKRLHDLNEPAQALLKQAENELRVETDRRQSQARFQQFVKLRDEAQFLGTLYTGMDLAANLDAARASVQQALAIYGVLEGGTKPALDAHLTIAQKSSIQQDCYQLLLILGETEAQSASDRKSPEKEEYLKKALSVLDKANQLGTPSRAYHLRRARYLSMLGDDTEAAAAQQAAQNAALNQALDHVLMADELYRREKFDDAIKEFDLVLERQPGHFWAQYLSALCLLRQNRHAEARTLLSACVAQRSDFVWLYLLRGYALTELRSWSAAEADFQKASQMPLDANARYVLFVDRGVLRVRTERFDEAVSDFQAAIELKPKAFQAYVNLAQAYRRLEKPDLALAQLDRAIEQEPGLAHLYRLRARLYLERNEPDRALASFNQAIERENTNSPFHVDDFIERGRLLLRTGQLDQALASFDAAIGLRKDHSLGQRLRAETLFRLGRFSEVVDAFDRYFENGGSPRESVYRGRGLAKSELGLYGGAIEDFTKALELKPTSEVQAYRGWTHLVVDAPKLALRDFEMAIELDGKNGDAYGGRGFVRANLGLEREALADAEEALRCGPASARLLYNVARIYAQCREPYPQRALDLIQRALGSLPVEERRNFWSQHIRPDPALASIRRYALFLTLDSEFSRRK